MPPTLEPLVTRLRKLMQAFPVLRVVLLPLYLIVDKCWWATRRFVSGHRPVVLETSHGPIYMVPEGHIARVVSRSGFEEPERRFVERYLKPGMSVLNVGANAGLYALLAGRIVGTTGEVHAFEPASVSVDRLRRNLKLNGLSEVVVNHCAVGETSGSLDLCRDPRHPDLDSHYSVRPLGEGGTDLIERIRSVSLDDYWSNTCAGQTRNVDMIVIDVEGAELQVLAGARMLLAESKRIMVMVECTEYLDEIDNLLRPMGFSYHRWDASQANFRPTTMVRGNLFISRLAHFQSDS